MEQLQNYKQSCTFRMNSTFFLLLNALLNVLYQVVASCGPLIVGICAHPDHEVSSFTLAHLRVKSLAKISNWITPTEARQPTVKHQHHSVDYPIHVAAGC